MEKSHQKHDSLKTGSPRIIGQDPVRYEGWGVRVPPVQEVSAPPPTHTHSETGLPNYVEHMRIPIEIDDGGYIALMGPGWKRYYPDAELYKMLHSFAHLTEAEFPLGSMFKLPYMRNILQSLKRRMQARVKAHANLAWMRRHWSRTPVVFWDRLQDFPYPDMLYNGNMRQSGLYKYPHGDPARWDSYFSFPPETDRNDIWVHYVHRPWGLESYS